MTRCAAACGRDLPDEELIETGGVLVCEPCHESIAKAAERRDSIDDAWRAVEASLPDGWTITGLTSHEDTWGAFAAAPAPIVPVSERTALSDQMVAFDTTPTRALRALARQLSGAT